MALSKPSAACQDRSANSSTRRCAPSIGFEHEILAERRECSKFSARGGDVGALARQVVGDAAPQGRIGNVMRRISRSRQITAGDLVFALRSGLDAQQFMGDGVVDGLIVAEFEMQERMVFDRAPMAAVQRMRAEE